MAAYAPKLDPVADVERWRVCGLLHDMDWERHPTREEHPFVAVKLLRERGVDEEILTAILGHAEYSGTPRVTPMAKALFAVDELTGLITATAYVKPTRSVHDVDAKGVRKRMKDKAFARGVSREDITQGAAELGVDLDDHIGFVIAAMQANAGALGLEGTGTMQGTEKAGLGTGVPTLFHPLAYAGTYPCCATHDRSVATSHDQHADPSGLRVRRRGGS